MTRRVIFLDRDGVLVVPSESGGRGFAPRTLEEFAIYPDAAESVRRLKGAGLDVVVVTNQPDIGAGLVDQSVVDRMHEILVNAVPVDRIRVCPHVQADGCSCRKPKSGLLLAEDEHDAVDFRKCWMVGDRDSDITAGSKVGCRTIFINRGWIPDSGGEADVVVLSLSAAVSTILGS